MPLKKELTPKSWTGVLTIRDEKEFGIAPDSFLLIGF